MLLREITTYSASAMNSALSVAGVEWVRVSAPEVEEVPGLLDAMANQRAAVVACAVEETWYAHMQGGHGIPVRSVPWVRLDCFLMRMAAWEEVGEFDETMPYWGFEWDWCYRARQMGWNVLVDGRHAVSALPLPAHYADSNRSTELALRAKWGPGWLARINPMHPNLVQGKENIYL